MIKYFLLFCLSILLSTNVNADICYDVTPKVVEKAVKILNGTQTVYHYCSICDTAESHIISIEKIATDNGVLINGQHIDLAHTYYKKDDKYINLGVAAGCINVGDYDIADVLPDLPVINITPEIRKQHAKEQAQQIFDTCSQPLSDNDMITTADMMKRNRKINNCLTDAIKKEVKKGFDTDRQPEVLVHLQKIQEGVFGIYSDIYAANKYCNGSCGTIANILPYADEGHVLMEILENLLYLNSAKSGY